MPFERRQAAGSGKGLDGSRDSSLGMLFVREDRTTANLENAMRRWSSLVASYRREANYWYLRYQQGAEVPDIGPRRREAERDRELALPGDRP